MSNAQPIEQRDMMRRRWPSQGKAPGEARVIRKYPAGKEAGEVLFPLDDECARPGAERPSKTIVSLATSVFEPLFSGREGGRGMRLTIVRNIVNHHGAKIEVMVDGRRRGANIDRLPHKRSRATVHAS